MSFELSTEGMQTTLAPGDTALARKAVFSCLVMPAAARLTHEATAGHEVGAAARELRAAVRLLDTLGWPQDGPGCAHLSTAEAEVVRTAARTHLAGGLDPDASARSRVARGPAEAPEARGRSMRRLLERLERDDG